MGDEEPVADHEGRAPTFVELPFDEGEVRLVRALCASLRTRLLDGGDDPDLARLHPTAYPDEQEQAQEAAWQLLARSALDDARLQSIAVVERTAAEGRATAAELHDWVMTINALRLVIGTQLDIRDDDDEPDWNGPHSLQWGLYYWLNGALLWFVTDAMEKNPSSE